jgi:hypothetical protein
MKSRQIASQMINTGFDQICPRYNNSIAGNVPLRRVLIG